MDKNQCIAVWCGQIRYANALDLQMQICGAKKQGWSADVLLLLEHPPTITRGRNAKQAHLLVSEALLKSRGVELWDTDRGGDVTFHGPGQLVGYPILSLGLGERDVHGYMRKLEDSLIRLLSCYGVEGKRDPAFPGVWTESGKIAAMGVHISRWVTRHGFALNVTTDLSYYNLIVPCGIVGKNVTSMQEYLSRAIGLEELADRYVREFGTVFHRDMVQMEEGFLREELRDFAGGAGAVREGQPPGITAV
jgi:lipoyl(octanoyl) transferase